MPLFDIAEALLYNNYNVAFLKAITARRSKMKRKMIIVLCVICALVAALP